MNKKLIIVNVVLVSMIAVLMVMIFIKTNNKQQAAKTESETSQPAPPAEQQPASNQLITYDQYQADPAKYNTDKIVFNFSAKWCPSCVALGKNLEENIDSIPKDLTIVEVDYDIYNDFKKQYSVTYQHSLILVDQSGNEIKRWSGGNTLQSIVDQV